MEVSGAHCSLIRVLFNGAGFVNIGGYSLSCGPGHWEWLSDLQKELSNSISFSIVIPAYTLAPKSQYPAQLKQAAETLQSLLEQGKNSSDVSPPSSVADVEGDY